MPLCVPAPYRSPFLLRPSIGVPRSVFRVRCSHRSEVATIADVKGCALLRVAGCAPSIDTAVMVAALIGGHCLLSPVFCHISGGGIFCKKNAVLLQNLVNNCISKRYVATLKKRNVASLCKLLIFSCFFATFQNPVLLQTNV